MEKKNTGLVVLVVVLALLVVGLGGFIVYDKVLSENDNTTVETVENNDSTKDSSTNNNINNYSLYSENLKNEVNSKYDENNLQYQTIFNDCVSSGYEISLNSKNELYITYLNDENLYKKYGRKKISDNVLSFYPINVGQSTCNMLYYIKLDGTVGSANTEYSVASGEDIKIENNIGEYKDIVAIVNGLFSDGYSGARGPIFIDINGNMFSENLK